MKKIILCIFMSISFNIFAADFKIEESNSEKAFSKLSIDKVNDYYRFTIDVRQKNNWNFNSSLFLNIDGEEKKIMAEYQGNSIIFTTTGVDFLNIMSSERMTVMNYINYDDSFYIPNFRELPVYKNLSQSDIQNYIKNN